MFQIWNDTITNVIKKYHFFYSPLFDSLPSLSFFFLFSSLDRVSLFFHSFFLLSFFSSFFSDPFSLFFSITISLSFFSCLISPPFLCGFVEVDLPLWLWFVAVDLPLVVVGFIMGLLRIFGCVCFEFCFGL